MGQEVKAWNLQEPPGYRQVVWDGKDRSDRAVPTGVYIYRLVATPANGGQPFVAGRKMLLLK